MYSILAVERASCCCFKRPTKLWPENRGEPRPACCCYTTASLPVGFSPTHPVPMYSDPAVGLYRMGDEVFVRGLLSYQGIEKGPWTGIEPVTSRIVAARC